jgi:hypothetical protein
VTLKVGVMLIVEWINVLILSYMANPEVTSAFESWRVFRHINCYLVVSATVVSAFDIYPSHDSSSDM